MFGTLRRRLIVSHVLPLLMVIPLMGIALVYVLESQVLVPSLLNELTGQAALIAELASDHTDIWNDPTQAQAFVVRVSPHLGARLMLLEVNGRILASSDPADVDRLGQQLERPGLAQARAGETSIYIDYSMRLDTRVAEVWVPVVGPDKRVAGIIRLTHRLVNVPELFLRLRYLIVGVLAAGLVLGTGVGWVLALNLEQSLQRVTQAIYRFASGQGLTPLPERGPEEIRLLLRAFNTLMDRLRTFEQNRRQLLANLVHELGRPLGALHSAIQALLGGADQDAALRRELLVGIDEELGRLRRLLSDLAGLHDQVLGVLELNRRPVALSDWLSHLMGPRRQAALRKGLVWEATISPDLPTLEIDSDRLGQAVGNLLDNAIKYTPPGGTISVEASVREETIWIQVSDTGPGIPPEEQARIFTPLYRGRSARRFPQGMGLGLSIARDLVVAHGGQIDVESAPGSGSHFTIRLPLP